MVKLPRGGWVSTIPLVCPACGLDWSDLGTRTIRGQVYRGWGAPPVMGAHATVYYECEACRHHVYCRD